MPLRTRLSVALAAAAVAALSVVSPATPVHADGPPRTPLGTWVRAEEWCITVVIGGVSMPFCGWQCPDPSADIIATDVFDGVRYCLVSWNITGPVLPDHTLTQLG